MSYARADAALALRFADALIAAGVSVWVDQYDIRPSQHWDRAVESAVRGCHGMLVMLSPRSVASANVLDEISVAIDEGKDVLPILIERCTVPLRMTRMQFIDATHDVPAAVRRCLDHVRQADRSEATGPSEVAGAPGKPSSVLADEIIGRAERRLTGVLGPIAAILVKRAAVQATSEADLYAMLARSIVKDDERENFLGWLAAAPAESRSPDVAPSVDRARLKTALTRQLGPIAGPLIDRELGTTGPLEDKIRRLSARIASEKDRGVFLREVGL